MNNFKELFMDAIFHTFAGTTQAKRYKLGGNNHEIDQNVTPSIIKYETLRI